MVGDQTTATYPPAWVAPYIGLRFAECGRDRNGVDCWGLVRLVAKERFGLDLPSIVGDYASTADAVEIARLVRRELPSWRVLPEGLEDEGDFLLIRMRNYPIHIAMVVAPGWMLHIEEGIEAVCERYGDRRWARRVIGAYRWEAAV